MTYQRREAAWFPECPCCHELCGKLARVCYACGAHLYDDVTNDGRRRLDPVLAPGVESQSMSKPPEPGEAAQAARERGA